MTYFCYDSPRDRRLIQLNDDPDDLWELMKLAPQLPNLYFMTYRNDRYPDIKTPNQYHHETSKFLAYHQLLADKSGQENFPLWATSPLGRCWHQHSILATSMSLLELSAHHIDLWKDYPHNRTNIKESIKPVLDIGAFEYIFGQDGTKLGHIQECARWTFIPNGRRYNLKKRSPFQHPKGCLKSLAKTRAYKATQ